LLACRSEDFNDSDDDVHNLNSADYIKDRRQKLESRLGLNSLPGMDSKSLGVTDDDFKREPKIKKEVSSKPPPKKKLKMEKSNDAADALEEWKNIFGSPPTGGTTTDDSSWPLKWFYSRIRLGLGSKVWEHRHGAACAIRAFLRKKGKLENHPQKNSWLVDIALRLITVLALDRFGDFVSDSVVAPIRETAAQVGCLSFIKKLSRLG